MILNSGQNNHQEAILTSANLAPKSGRLLERSPSFTLNDQVYSPTNIAMERDFSFWASQIKSLLQRMDLLENENKQLHSKVICSQIDDPKNEKTRKHTPPTINY